MLKIEHVYVSIQKKEIIKNVSFSLQSSDKMIIVGPNGAGKTTLLKAVAGIHPLSKWTITLKDQEITGWDIAQRVREGLTYLLQTGNVFLSLSVKDNLTIAGYYKEKKQFDAITDIIFNTFPFLKNNFHKLAGLLSGGERQALAISMVLMTSPSFILLDEPLAGLSPSSSQNILSALNALQKEKVFDACCIIEHNLEKTIPWANRLILIKEGEVHLETDNTSQFKSNTNVLEELFLS